MTLVLVRGGGKAGHAVTGWGVCWVLGGPNP